MAQLEAALQQWAILLALTAFSLSLVVLGQLLTTHATAYLAAPREVALLLETLDATVEENESYDRHLTKVPRLEDKVRLSNLLRDIQRGGDDLREALHSFLVLTDTTKKLTFPARALWAVTRKDLEERMRRLDMMRMRFLVVYLGLVAERATTAADKQQQQATPPHLSSKDAREKEKDRMDRMGMAAPAASQIPETPSPAPTPAMLSRSMTDEIKQKPPLRRLTTQAIGYSSGTRPGHRAGWAGVVDELQKSPKLKARHASIERSIDQELALSRLP
ncbi:hypothetical protein SODALDRAFT_280024 [Sodiomyces alkalinus F11]|uniref:Uncharacterized protein n=1 Tax=Sodiomyces alkalinus (strain CBS 110278 / VKM F-3762 / F11) TaxID=1314773 RepID=A0A3N2PTC9_SODAK|nr:hypothetical protein SODALDRAFT_280024 [Sodiomyces alkalinus F11]ROT37741.1 hypothetical protein SODALDRAFT_280024 [Sodiomyces alkalinus F11]